MISNWHSMIIASLAGIPAITKPEEDGAEEHVVLLHGLGRTARSMSVIGWALEQEGYRVVNIGYPSTKGSISALADRAISKAVNLCGDAHRVHFVTHSMGGILLRHWMNENALPQAGRAVMLGPPNGGSEIVDAFCDWRSFRLLHGPAGRELTTREDRGPRRLSCCAPLETGIIAGTRSLNPLTSAFIRGDRKRVV